MEKLMQELKGAAESRAMTGMEDVLKSLSAGEGLGVDDIEQAKALWKMLDDMAENDPQACA
jgi:hypothetical protein